MWHRHFVDEENQQHDQADTNTKNPAHLRAFGECHKDAANAHDGSIAEHTQAHGYQHLHLGYVVGGAGNQAGSGKVVQLGI